jgi:uncharacterized FlaG/YvyC family protein
LDVTTNEVVDSLDLPDIYISKYFFNPEGSKLYLTTASSGSPEQQANLKTDVMLSFDLAALPKLSLQQETKLGSSVGTLDFQVQDGQTQLILSSNSQEGVVTLICGETDQVIEKIPVAEPQPHSRLWLLA